MLQRSVLSKGLLFLGLQLAFLLMRQVRVPRYSLNLLVAAATIWMETSNIWRFHLKYVQILHLTSG